MQSIYSFRNARTKVFFDKKKQVKNQVELKNNYRSNKALVGFINDFFGSYNDSNYIQVFNKMNSKSKRKLSDYPVSKFILCNKTQSQEKAICTEIKLLLEKSAKPIDICVLSRENSSLLKISKELTKYKHSKQTTCFRRFFKKMGDHRFKTDNKVCSESAR